MADFSSLPTPPRSWYAKLRPPQLLAAVYALGALLATLALHLPGVLQPNSTLTSMDLFFTATSALTVTGLTVADTSQHFTRFGEVILMVLFGVGGLGIVSFGSLFALMMRRKVNFSEKRHLQAQISGLDTGSVLGLLRTTLLYAVGLQSVGFLLLCLRWVPSYGLEEGTFHALFHSISAFNNAGFIILPGGLSPHAGDPLVSLTLAGLIVLGSLGFIVQFNVAQWLRSPRKNRLTIYSLLTLGTTAVLLLLSFVLIVLLEWNNSATFGNMSPSSKLLSSFFHAVTPRSGGMTIVEMSSFSSASIMLTVVLMYIGGGSGSTGGGIKTSTFAILAGSAWNMVLGRGELVLARRKIDRSNVTRASAVALIYSFLVIGAFFAMLVTNPHLEMSSLFFETISAAATAGLSLGITSQINDAGLFILSVLMYLGRIGPMTFALAFSAENKESEGIDYPSERDIVVG